MRYELWCTTDESGVARSFFPVDANYEQKLHLLDPGAALTWTVEAGSWNEAMTAYHQYMGWSPYCPPDT